MVSRANKYKKLLNEFISLKKAYEQLRKQLAKTESDLAKTKEDLNKANSEIHDLSNDVDEFGENVKNGLYEVDKNIKFLNDVISEINHLESLPQTRNVKNRLYELDSEKLHRIQTIKFMLKNIGKKLVCENGVYAIK